MSDIAPHPNPTAPVRKLVADDGTVTYTATCGVYGCAWSLSASTRAYVEEQATYHRHQHRSRVPANDVWQADDGAWHASCACPREWEWVGSNETAARAALHKHQADAHGVIR